MKELRAYVPNGKESMVVLSHNDDNYISSRLLLDSFGHFVEEDFSTRSNFHPEYRVSIAHRGPGENDED